MASGSSNVSILLRHALFTYCSSFSLQNFRKKLIAHYGVEECMISGIAPTGRTLTAGHIWRASHDLSVSLTKFGLTSKDVESYRNGLLLSMIEDAFDVLQLCFFYNFITVSLNPFFLL